MSVRHFEHRLNRMEWQPSAEPSAQIVADVLGHSKMQPQWVEWAIAGTVLGILIGFGIKGTVMPGGPFGAHADLLGYIIGAISLLAGAGSVAFLAITVALRNQVPQLFRFSLFNMLMIMVLMLS